MPWFRKKVEPFGLGWRSFVHFDPRRILLGETRIYTVPYNYHLHLISLVMHVTTPGIAPGGGSLYPVDHYRGNHHISRSVSQVGVGANLDVPLFYWRCNVRPVAFAATPLYLVPLCYDIYLYPHDTIQCSIINAGFGTGQYDVVYHFRQWITS